MQFGQDLSPGKSGAASSSAMARGRSSMNDPGENRSYAKLSSKTSTVFNASFVSISANEGTPIGTGNREAADKRRNVTICIFTSPLLSYFTNINLDKQMLL
jgi:hypothetical protein